MDDLTQTVYGWWWVLVDRVAGALEYTYTGAVLANSWDLVAQLWPYVAIGALLSVLARHHLPGERFKAALSRRVNGSIVAAALLGLVSPLCTFAAIPVVGTLLTAGFPAAPLMAFLICSPLMNPALFVYTYGAIGLEMAIARVVTALCMGLLAGFGTRLAHGRGILDFQVASEPRRPYPAVAGGSGRRPPGSDTLRGLKLAIRDYPAELAFIGKYFALGILVASLAAVLLSADLIVAVVGPGSPWAVPLAVALGVPLYACGGGAIPVVETMLRMGMTPGAALAFFTAGPATKFSTLSVFAAVFGRRLLGWYLALMLGGAVFFGYLFPFQDSYLSPPSQESVAGQGPWE